MGPLLLKNCLRVSLSSFGLVHGHLDFFRSRKVKTLTPIATPLFALTRCSVRLLTNAFSREPQDTLEPLGDAKALSY